MKSQFSHDNNFNLIRMVAAICVLISHAYPIALGPGAVEPLEHETGFSLGTIAVFVFFTASGFLISASYVNRSSILSFCKARIFRIYPGLVISNIVVVFILGLIFTSLPLAEYFAAPDTWMFLARNTVLLSPMYELPGVFDQSPYHAIVGSIWTIFYEIACYVLVAIVGWMGFLKRRSSAVAVSLAWMLFATAYVVSDVHTIYQIDKFMELSVSFAWGIFIWSVWDVLGARYVGALALLLIAVMILLGTSNVLLLYPAIAFVTIALAFLPSRFLGLYNRLGDYSYGFYLYAFPIQGAVVAVAAGIDPVGCMIWAAPITLAISVISWRLIERPFIVRKTVGS
ncbi:acyltransferase [Frigidibacter sp. RF13]|uniref:acyltransferase family protein n=1 Tax=Frigidibacter sp. RF13 TaxID=2997340 RepID=UPI0022714096|nr:acyltransferase [Frigidibacter sp. RF13]MCY1126028.1 acyltransferase [Frigidibacter sp. RF13]